MSDLDEYIERRVMEKQQLIGNLAWKDAVIAYLVNEGPVEVPTYEIEEYVGKTPIYTKMGTIWKIEPPA